MGIDPESFRWMTLAELMAAHKAWNELRELEYRERWERERWNVANAINIQLAPKDRSTPDEMFPFPWDKKRKKRKVATKKEDIAAICAEARRLAEEE